MTLIVPKAIFEQHIIALGKTGAGKSSAVRYLVEDLLNHEERVIAVTAKSDWWGIKLSADGKQPGYPVVIFGGDHADVPLNHLSGKTMAELLGTGNRSAVLQMRDFTTGERTRFWIDFASHLFRLLKGKLFLVIDEVHNFAPKGKILSVEAGEMLHWSNKLASEARGLGITLIAASQRASKVHNDFLTSCETLIAMRVTTKWDRDAVKDWIEGCGDEDRGKDVLMSLAQMKRGDAWVWSPEAEFGPKQLHFPMFTTYDSFRPQTPKDAKRLRGWADVDLAEVKKKLESVVKEAEANDPHRLRLRIHELELQLRSRPSGKPVEVKVADPKAVDRAVSQVKAESEKAMRERDTLISRVRAKCGELAKQMAELAEIPLSKKLEFAKASGPAPVSPGATTHQVQMVQPHRPAPIPETDGDFKLQGPHKKILRALAELRSIGKETPTREEVAGWSEYSVNGSAFKNPVSALNVAGYLHYPNDGTLALTDSGQAATPAVAAPTQSELRARIKEICTGPEWKILSVLLENGTQEMSREDVANASSYSMLGSAFKNPVSALSSKGLLEYPRDGYLKPAPWLFLE